MKKIISNLLHRFKEDSLAKRTGLVNRVSEYPEREGIKKCLVFWMENPEAANWLKALSATFKDVKIDKLCFVADDWEGEEKDGVVVLKSADLGFGGKIQNAHVLEILERPYDLLVDLTAESTVMGDYVLSNNQAKCIATMKKENAKGDLIIAGSRNPIDFIEKLNNFLSEVKKY
ncbi:MAG: hypothetical protein K2O69_07970 [Odoribacter sp.]|nr:hypothetical protein [Odoribacter sp.]